MTPYSPKTYARPPFRHTQILVSSTTYILNMSTDGRSYGTGLIGLWETADGGLFVAVLGMKVVIH